MHIDVSLPTGTVFLWMYWPSFNAALVAPDYVAQHRSVINTYFSLAAACVTTFALSPVFQREGGKWRLSMVRKLLTFRFYFMGGGGGKICVRGARMVQWREHRLTSLIPRKSLLERKIQEFAKMFRDTCEMGKPCAKSKLHNYMRT